MGRGTSGAKKSAGGRLGTKITVSMLAVLALVTILAGFSLYAVLSLTPARTRPGQTPATEAASDQTPAQIAALLSEVRTLEQHFSRQQDPASVVQFDEASKNLLARAQELEKKAGQRKDPKVVQAAAQILQMLPEYSASFKNIAQELESRGPTADSGLRQQLAQAGSNLGQPPAPALTTQGLVEELVQLGRAEQNYFAARTIDNQRLLSKAVATLAEDAGKSGLPGPEQQALSMSIKAYTAAFDRYLAVSLETDDPALGNAFATEQVKQEEAMHRATLEMEKLLSGHNAALTGATVQSLRQAEEEYSKLGSADSAARVATALAGYGKTLENAPVPENERAALQKAAADYQGAFAALVEQDKKIAALQAAIDKTFAALQAKVKEITPLTAPSAAAWLPLLPLTSQSVLLVIGSLWLATVLLTLLLARILAASFTIPLQRMTSEGDFNQTFPPDKHEFGALTSALNDQSPRPDIDSESATAPQQEKIDGLTLLIKDRNAHDALIAGVVAGQEEALAAVRSALATMLAAAANLQPHMTELAKYGQEVRNAACDCDQAVTTAFASVQVALQSSTQLTTSISNFADMAEQTSVVALNAAIKSTRTTPKGHEFSAVTEELDRLAKHAAEAAREISQLVRNTASGLAAGEKQAETSRQALQHLAATSATGQQAFEAIARATDAIRDSAGAVAAQLAGLGESSSQTGRLVHGLESLNREIADALALLGAPPAAEPAVMFSRDENESRKIGAALDLSLAAADQDKRS